MSNKIKLDPHESRQLTDRECAKILGGTVGALLDMAPPSAVRNAVRWWAETDEAWAAMGGNIIGAQIKQMKK